MRHFVIRDCYALELHNMHYVSAPSVSSARNEAKRLIKATGRQGESFTVDEVSGSGQGLIVERSFKVRV
jgi:hypothetical protein